ncbi:MAG: hypothetical protein PHU51_01475 [Candidatus Nanoarchaeia archaeon]|nr:hypothetical protein [Candidatus Nanoarchaeia archaeon]
MKQEVSQKNYLEKLHSFKKSLFSEFSWLESRDVCLLMGKLAHYHYNKNKFILLGKEKEIYDFLIKHSYNPYTIYRWLLLERIPDDIKHQLKNKEMSQKKAVSEAFKRRKETTESICLSVKELGLALIRRM